MTSSTEATSSTPQVAVNDIGSEEAFLAAIDETIKYFNDGDIVEGTVVKVDRDEVLLDIGYKTEGVIPSRELSIKHDVDPNEVVKVGDHVEALVLQKEDKEGRLILSKKRAQYERAWGTIEKIKDEDGIVTGTVIEVVKGGLILDIGLRGFLPASLVEMRRVRDLQPYVGRELEAKIIELDKNRNNVVLSRRAYLEQTQSEVRSEFLNQLQKGQVRKGVVSSIVNFGAFVDLGGVDGLVHVSELSWKHIDHPSEVVEVGQEVTVEVLDVDMERERVSLSLKATQEDPWRQFARTHAIGQIVPGKVTKLVPFGAFVRVDEGIEGLVHISELAERHVEIPEQVVQVNDDVMVKVIDIDLDRRRISLSLKQANEGFTTETEFDPTQYGMAAEYDAEGNYIYPEGFDPETQDWQEGFDKQREEWERQYAEAHTRYEAHMKQIVKAAEADAEGNYVYPDGFDPETGEWLEGYDKQREEWERQYAEARQRWEAHTKQVQTARAADADASEAPAPTGPVSSSTPSAAPRAEEPSGTLATDEALAALREKLAGGK
jgi:small subunit ribosomal protein S1